jgi:quinol monooxygenase YgiN
MIHVVATIQLQSGSRDAFLAEFHKLVPLVKAEAGCIDYGPTVDVATSIPVQDPVRSDVVTVIEKWSDLNALNAHLKAPHMGDYRIRVKDYVRSVKLQVLQPV